MMKRTLGALSLISMFAIAPLSVFAGNEALSLENVAKVDVLSGWREPNGNHMAAIRIRLAPGWKTYWRAPGDAGIPPRFSWQGSRNIKAVRFHWPTPTLFHQNGTRSIGYKDQVVLPVEFTPTNGADPSMKVQIEMELGVCEEVCLPLAVSLNANLPSGGSVDRAIKQSLADVPMTARSANVRSVTCKVDQISDGLRVTAQIKVPKMGQDEVAILELADQNVWISESVTTRSGAALTAISDLVPPQAAPFLLNRSDLRITILGGGQAIDISGCPSG